MADRRDDPMMRLLATEETGSVAALAAWGFVAVLAVAAGFASWQYAPPTRASRPLDAIETTGAIPRPQPVRPGAQPPPAADPGAGLQRDLEQIRQEIADLRRLIGRTDQRSDLLARRVGQLEDQAAVLANGLADLAGGRTGTIDKRPAAAAPEPPRTDTQKPEPQPEAAPRIGPRTSLEPEPRADAMPAATANASPSTSSAAPATPPAPAAVPSAAAPVPVRTVAIDPGPPPSPPSQASPPAAQVAAPTPHAPEASPPAPPQAAPPRPAGAMAAHEQPVPSGPPAGPGPMAGPSVPAPPAGGGPSVSPAAAGQPAVQAAPAPADPGKARPAARPNQVPTISIGNKTQIAERPGPPTPLVPPAAPPTRIDYGVDLGGFRNLPSLRKAWSDLDGKAPRLTRSYAPLAQVKENDESLEVRLIAGPFPSSAEAAKYCKQAQSAGIPCAPAAYAGQPTGR
ncbi:SPOR domain-containing protein [Prosthecomicrobium sp. N25]|uniref:SPOR domain-containing protein n=1 Tax=Prosthecomicrobium sp. N25 TaxID=3129254 RepID=UPI003076FA47